MLYLEKDGIVFVLVQKRFDLFEQMTRRVTAPLQMFKGRPVVIVFPEAVRGIHPIRRVVTKEWIQSVQNRLAEHGNAFVFFSVIEQGGKNAKTNTGYLVQPTPVNKKDTNIQWKAYPKLEYTHFEDLSKIKENDRWNKRGQKVMARGGFFSFPTTTIKTNKGTKTIELRVCADSHYLPTNPDTNIFVVPAAGLHNLQVNTKNLKDYGFAVINDLNLQKASQARLLTNRLPTHQNEELPKIRRSRTSQRRA